MDYALMLERPYTKQAPMVYTYEYYMNQAQTPQEQIEEIYEEGNQKLEAIEREQKKEFGELLEKLKEEKINTIKSQL